MEKFNPSDPGYKSVEDLPEEQQEKYVDVPEGGFITKTAELAQKEAERKAADMNEARGILDKLRGKNETDAMDVLHQEAIEDKIAGNITSVEREEELNGLYQDFLGFYDSVHLGSPLPRIDSSLLEKRESLLYLKNKVEQQKRQVDQDLYKIALYISFIAGGSLLNSLQKKLGIGGRFFRKDVEYIVTLPGFEHVAPVGEEGF